MQKTSDASHPCTLDTLARLWAASQPAVASFISLLLPDFHDAEDVLQEVAAAVLSHDSKKTPMPQSFNAWVIGIARHKVMDVYRRRNLDHFLFNSTAIENLALAHSRLVDQFNVRREALEHCRKKLVGKSREILDLRYQNDMDMKEIARKTGMGVSAVKVTLHRVRNSLRECIERRLRAGGGWR